MSPMSKVYQMAAVMEENVRKQEVIKQAYLLSDYEKRIAELALIADAMDALANFIDSYSEAITRICDEAEYKELLRLKNSVYRMLKAENISS